MIPYGRQTIDEDDIQAVIEVLRSDYLTTGPKVAEFEQVVASYVRANYGVAVANGTAALHCAMYALNIGPGDEVIVPPITFAATANAVCFMGGTPVFADVDKKTLLIDPDAVREKISPKTRAIIGVDYAGLPCDWDQLRSIADEHGLYLVADGCHALGGEYKGRKVGTLADITVFSFHPVKHIATGEGGMVVTDNAGFAEKVRLFRSHGITTDARQREATGAWFYEMVDLGFNYRITDIQCALGVSQMGKLEAWLLKRRKIAAIYDAFFEKTSIAKPLFNKSDSNHAYHLYVVEVQESAGHSRNTLFDMLRQKGIGVNVHYVPVHLHPYYRKRFGYGEGLCPVAEHMAGRILSIPMFAGLSDVDLQTVLSTFQSLEDGLL